MSSRKEQTVKNRLLKELMVQLDEDRAWLLEQIDQGRWSELRVDLATLEREMGQFLTRAIEALEEEERGKGK